MKKKKLKHSTIKYGIEVFTINMDDGVVIECWECGQRADYLLAQKADYMLVRTGGFYCKKCLKKKQGTEV